MFHYNHIHVDLALHGNTSYGPRRICRPLLGPSPVPGPPLDDLPNPPEIDEDVDIAESRTLSDERLALHAGPGAGPQARIPDALFAQAARMPVARAYAPLPPEPVGPQLRQRTARVPEGQPADWDLSPSIPVR